MTAVSYPALRCDAPDPESSDGQCSTEWGAPIYMANATELRRHLKQSGWSQPKPGRDICPACTEKAIR